MFGRCFFLKKKPVVYFLDARVVRTDDANVSLYASCWICFRDPDDCLALAEFYLKDGGYELKEINIPIREIGRKDYKEGKLLKYHKEALKVGRSVVFHPYKIFSPSDL